MRFRGLFPAITHTFVLLAVLGLSLSCSKRYKDKSGTTGRISPTYQGPKEPAYCGGSPTSYGDAVTISGVAQYTAREVFLVSGSNGGLGSPSAPRPIRHAEVRVTNSVGDVVQCTETDASGNFSFTLPRGDGQFLVSVNARADNSFLKATIFNAPEQNVIYAIKQNVIANSSQSLGTLTATADGDVLGGAFNILDQIHNANDFLRSKVATCSSTFSECPNFSVATKVSVYWEAGFNPGSYFPNTGPLSFYLPGYRRLFVLGGSNGDVNSSDTDHFDNSVVLHEYGHFLEDAAFRSDSPGGEHNGNRVIDPRLAWSEGWGNFFQAAVQGSNYYIDTMGNSSGSTSFIFRIDVEDLVTSGANKSNDVPVFDGEGNFREFSVTRLLFDVTDAADVGDDNDNVADGFAEIWAALTSNIGFIKGAFAYREVGLLHDIVANRLSGSPQDWYSLRQTELHGNTTLHLRKEYGRYVTTATSTCGLAGTPYSITPYDDPSDNGSFSTSHLLKNNDFYHYKHGGGAATFTLNYQTPTGTEADLDFYLYNTSARFGISEDIAGFGRAEPTAPGGTSGTETETISIANLPAGDYLLNVMVYTGGNIGAATNYEIRVGGALLCPTILP